MNDIDLAQLFVDFAETNKRLEELRTQIEKGVLERQSTVKIAGVTATYYKPSFETPDYQHEAMAVIPADFDLTPYSTTTIKTRWKEICDHFSVECKPGAPVDARVVVKIS
jgi:hypothetical protein